MLAHVALLYAGLILWLYEKTFKYVSSFCRRIGVPCFGCNDLPYYIANIGRDVIKI